MSALLIWKKIPVGIAIPLGFSLDIGLAYGIAQLIRSLQ
jgi:hypothetical protein